MSAVSYERLLATVEALTAAPSVRERDVRWATDSAVVGVARAVDGKIEIFLSGDPLVAASNSIREVLEHQIWHRHHDLPTLEANRLLLPLAGHFDQMAALICTELLRNGADTDLARAFRLTEPLIELAMTRMRLSDQALLGLAGELLFLNSMCQQGGPGRIGDLVNAWDGWKESRRDFALGSVGIEVKTTTRASSIHQIQGVHQLERHDGGIDQAAETALLLVSIGLIWDEQDSGFTIPGLVDSVLEQLRGAGREDLVDVFLAHVREYGTSSEIGYNHGTMSGDVRFNRKFIPRFVRGYDMTDPTIQVLRSDDLAPYSQVVADSVMFRIRLPDRVSGDVNPVWGLHETASAVLDAHK